MIAPCPYKFAARHSASMPCVIRKFLFKPKRIHADALSIEQQPERPDSRQRNL